MQKPTTNLLEIFSMENSYEKYVLTSPILAHYGIILNIYLLNVISSI